MKFSMEEPVEGGGDHQRRTRKRRNRIYLNEKEQTKNTALIEIAENVSCVFHAPHLSQKLRCRVQTLCRRAHILHVNCPRKRSTSKLCMLLRVVGFF